MPLDASKWLLHLIMLNLDHYRLASCETPEPDHFKKALKCKGNFEMK